MTWLCTHSSETAAHAPDPPCCSCNWGLAWCIQPCFASTDCAACSGPRTAGINIDFLQWRTGVCVCVFGVCVWDVRGLLGCGAYLCYVTPSCIDCVYGCMWICTHTHTQKKQALLMCICGDRLVFVCVCVGVWQDVCEHIFNFI